MLTNDTFSESQCGSRSTEFAERTRIVFRVFDSTSFRAYDPATGFLATGFDENTPINHSGLLRAHLDPNNRTIITPWISTTRRWLWAVWEMNRRYESQYKETAMGRPTPNIQVAVIDLSVCQENDRSITSPPAQAPILRLGNRGVGAEASDDVLIYGRIPASAIISLWKIEKLFGIQGLPRLFSFQTLSHSGKYPSFSEVQGQLVEVLRSPSKRASWKATEEGERCASIATTLLKVGYDRLERQINRMIEPIRESRSRASGRTSRSGSDENMNNLAGEMGSLSTGEGSSAGARGSSSKATNHASASAKDVSSNYTPGSSGTRSDAVEVRNKSTASDQDIEYMILPSDVIGYSDPPIFAAYMSFVAHHRLIKVQILARTPGRIGTGNNQVVHVPRFLANELSHFDEQRSYYEPILIRIIRQKIERFRGIVLEFARTVPIGVFDQLDIDQHDWDTMQWFMMGHINAWLAPLERKLDGLERAIISDQKIQARLGWLGKEGKYLWRDQTLVFST